MICTGRQRLVNILDDPYDSYEWTSELYESIQVVSIGQPSYICKSTLHIYRDTFFPGSSCCRRHPSLTMLFVLPLRKRLLSDESNYSVRVVWEELKCASVMFLQKCTLLFINISCTMFCRTVRLSILQQLTASMVIVRGMWHCTAKSRSHRQV